ncbi:MAG: hypothetical protein IKK70_03105 [Clostridia bacterium]|nr:hypothetical protein [Clostridia bacterium]
MNTKRLIALLIAAALTAVAFTITVSAIAADGDASADGASIVEADSEAPAEEIEIAEGGVVADEALSVTVESYMFGAERLLLVTVENLSDVAYSIEASVSYLGVNGEVIGTETQLFEQLGGSASWNMVFRPEYDFADYRIEVKNTEFNGDCWLSDVGMSYYGMSKGYGDYSKDDMRANSIKLIGEYEGEKCSAYYRYPAYHCQNDSGRDIVATSVVLVIFDCNGNVYDVLERGGEVFFGTDSDYTYKNFPGYAFVAGDKDAENELGGIENTTAFVAFTAILAEDSVYCK